MPLWAALPRRQRLVYIICAFVHTTRKDVRSIYLIYVAYVRTCIYVYFVHLWFNSDLPSIYLIRSGDGRISSSILPRWDLSFHRSKARGQPKRWAQRTEINSNSRMCGGWGMPLWAALPRHQRLVYIICAFVHTTRKDVRSIYLIYVAYVRTCIYVYFVHLWFNSDLPSIYLIRSGDGRISSSILPTWDLFFHRCKERGQLKSWVQRMEI